MARSVTRKPGETWRQCVERYGAACGLETEVLEVFDREVAEGLTEGNAAWCALREWDLLDFENNED
jgi:hypothetical protein